MKLYYAIILGSLLFQKPLCDQSEQELPLPEFFCPAGQVPEPICKNSCDSSYKALQHAAIQLYCESTNRINQQHEKDIQLCLQQYDYCVLNNNPAFCLQQVNDCLARADWIWADWLLQIESNYDKLYKENIASYLVCMANCCSR